ncbi:Os07g0651600 [Oryza sativa Japonica Group]|uniref:Os07g0651600 protein n=2 Tax=Oryza TaxID=4527 RepID=Q0D423_ORYSJ|nr:Os07g0651600 [Oryza sativa Japonica Group]|eukprot:NP_001060486.2 Os07g0651600 [Oryza sativa Japonica Group]
MDTAHTRTKRPKQSDTAAKANSIDLFHVRYEQAEAMRPTRQPQAICGPWLPQKTKKCTTQRITPEKTMARTPTLPCARCNAPHTNQPNEATTQGTTRGGRNAENQRTRKRKMWHAKRTDARWSSNGGERAQRPRSKSTPGLRLDDVPSNGKGHDSIPAAIAHVELAGLRLNPKGYDGQGGTPHLVPSLKIFYGMVISQGIPYIVAGILEVFSFIPQRALIRNGGFTGQWGVESVNLYYAYAYDKYMEGERSDQGKAAGETHQFNTDDGQIDKIKKHDIAGDQEPTEDIDNLLEAPTRSMHINDQRYIPRIWQRILEYWSIPKEQPLTDDDLLPALGMSIIYSLAECDQNNCVEIDKVTDLIPKIIGFTSFRSAMVNSEAQQKVLLKSSLKVLQRLTSIEGEIGITLRYKISKHPFLLRNLAEILGDSSSNNQELRRLMAGILRNLAIDKDTRQEIGQMKMLITRLMKAFLDSNGSFSSNVDCLLPKVAGQALVLERIIDAEGAELEILIGLSSQICKLIPEEFAQELEHGQIKRRFIKRLVDALNANMKQNAHCPGIRRVILEQSIYMMECNSRNAKCFNEFRMMDSVSMVEETPSRAEKYMFFLGDMGFMECKTALSALVDRAKELISRQWLHDINSAN